MYIVPLPNDKITTKEGDTFVVETYTNLKSEPAVYIKAPENENNTVYFMDIEEINGVKVDYHSTNNVFEALGTVKRRYNLPQPDDMIDVGGEELVEVKSLKLHSKTEGISKGLLVCGEDSCYDISSINDVDRNEGSERFSKDSFEKLYKDYLPFDY